MDFRVKMGGERSEGESMGGLQMNERWNEETFGTGGSGSKTPPLRRGAIEW